MSGQRTRDIRDVEALARWLDSQFRVPGTQFRFGVDGLIGLIPVAGDTLSALLGAYIILRAVSLGVPASIILQMMFNLAVDTLLGAVPLVGDAFDFAFRAHARNARLLERHIKSLDT